MLHRQTHKSYMSMDVTKAAQTTNRSSVCSYVLKFLTISTVLIMSLTIKSVLAYPAYSFQSAATPKRHLFRANRRLRGQRVS